jgi:hypothetical protein
VITNGKETSDDNREHNTAPVDDKTRVVGDEKQDASLVPAAAATAEKAIETSDGAASGTSNSSDTRVTDIQGNATGTTKT